MKRILYIISNPFNFRRRSVGGNISSASGIINGFRTKGYHIDIVTDSVVPTLENNQGNMTIIKYPFRYIRSLIPYRVTGIIGKILTKLDSKLFQYAMKAKIEKILNNNIYEFCYMRASYNGHALSDAIISSGTKLVLEVNKPLSMGPYNNKEKSNWPNRGDKVKVPLAESMQYEMASIITVDSTLRAKWVTEFVGKQYEDKILINHNGVDVEMFAPSLCDSALKNELVIADHDVVVGMASSFRWYNDIDEMFLIISRASKRFDGLKFVVIVGDKNKENEIAEKIKKHSLSPIMRIFGQVPFHRMPSLLNCCDILISHFNFHGKWPHNCSIKHLEYLAMGKPTVATNVGEVNFAIEHNVNGLLCDEGDIDQFSNSIARLASDPMLRKQLGKAGRAKALKELGWEFNVNRIISRLN